MHHSTTVLLVCLIVCGQRLFGQESQPSVSLRGETIDSAAIARIIDEGMNRSQVMDMLSWLTDVCGPRLTGSPGFAKAVTWAKARLSSMGLQNVHVEGWAPFGRSWSLNRYSAHITDPTVFPLLSYPRAWSPGTGGKVTGKVIYLDARTDSALETFHGKLKGNFVLLGAPVPVRAHFEPLAVRESDSTLLSLANAELPVPRGVRRRLVTQEARQQALIDYKKLLMCQDEGAAALITPSRGDGGNVFVQAAAIPAHPDTPYASRPQIQDLSAPDVLPQVTVAAEPFDRIVRILAHGIPVSMEMDLDVTFYRADSGYNVIAEMPGTDLEDEVVMIGAHLDSWHGGTGATDNGTGVTTCMEAMRILEALHLKPRRTIRVALWGAEEQGLLGSRAYVRRHFGGREGDSRRPDVPVSYKPEAENFCAYFNNDNGTGKVRGIYLQGNEALRPIFRAWLAPFRSMGASTITVANTGSTDHVSFDAIGLPGFQFIQDDIEYFSRTWHSTMDVYDRVQADDVKQASIIMAAFAYNAAMRDERLPRKPPLTH